MCRFFNYCDKPCKSQKSHYIHWAHIRMYCKDKDPTFLNYNVYKRLLHVDDEEILVKRQKRVESPSIHRVNYEKYLIQNMVSKMIDNIIDSIPDH
jgi:hypothetical protein